VFVRLISVLICVVRIRMMLMCLCEWLFVLVSLRFETIKVVDSLVWFVIMAYDYVGL
jgi:hypothetical protein